MITLSHMMHRIVKYTSIQPNLAGGDHMNHKQLKNQIDKLGKELRKLDSERVKLQDEFNERYPSLRKLNRSADCAYVASDCTVDLLEDCNMNMRKESLNAWLRKTATLVAEHMLLSRLLWKIHELFCPKHTPSYSEQEYVIIFSIKTHTFSIQKISDTINILDITFPDADTAERVVAYLAYLIDEEILIFENNKFHIDRARLRE